MIGLVVHKVSRICHRFDTKEPEPAIGKWGLTMQHASEAGSESDVDALSLRMKVFAVVGVAVVLCFSIYSFIAVGRAFGDRECAPVCSKAGAGDGGVNSADDFSYRPGTFICVNGAAEGGTVVSLWDRDENELVAMWDRDGLFALHGRVLSPETRDAFR